MARGAWRLHDRGALRGGRRNGRGDRLRRAVQRSGQSAARGQERRAEPGGADARARGCLSLARLAPARYRPAPCQRPEPSSARSARGLRPGARLGTGGLQFRPEVRREQLRVHARDRAARPLRRHPREVQAVRRAQRERQEAGRVRPRRRPGSGQQHRDRELQPRPAAAARPLPRRVRPARHRQVGRAQLPGARARDQAAARRARGGLRPAAGAEARALHDPRLGRGPRGRAPAGGRRSDHALRRLLRHQGGGGLRAPLPAARGPADPRLGGRAGGPEPVRHRHVRRHAAVLTRGLPRRVRRG